MARPLRIEYPGAFYHVTSRGNARQRIFKDDQDRLLFLDILKQVVDRYQWQCHAYCLMGNHYHLVVETVRGNLAIGMRHLNGVYTQSYNRRHRLTGHVFQGRYKAILIDKESHALEVCRYVVLNPVRAKMVEGVDQWAWSSYRGTAGTGRRPVSLTVDWLLAQFGASRDKAQAAYRDFVREGVNGESIHVRVRGQSLLGRDEFIEAMIGQVTGKETVREIPRVQRHLGRPSLEKLLGQGAEKDTAKRNRRIAEAVEKHGYSQKEVADRLGMHYSTISKLLAMPKFKT